MKEKLFYVKYSIQIFDGIEEYKGHIYAESENHAQQIINQIAYDLNAKDKFIDVVEEIKD